MGLELGGGAGIGDESGTLRNRRAARGVDEADGLSEGGVSARARALRVWGASPVVQGSSQEALG